MAAARQLTKSSRQARALDRVHRARDTPRHRSLVLAWARQWLRRPERRPMQALPEVAREQVGITFVGHATVLVRYANLSILCDPMLGGRVGAARRAIAPGLGAADLGDVHLILISHAHGDHLHRPTLARLPRSATLIVPPETAHYVSHLGFARVVELGPGQSLQHRRVDVASVAVQHAGKRGTPCLAYTLRGPGPSVFFCGDSGYCDTFAKIGAAYRPDIALLPIGGYWPPSFRERHMSPLDALYAFEDLQSRVLVPIHHGTFALSYELLHDPSRWLAELIRERDLEEYVAALDEGETRVFTLPRPAKRAP
jgi:L-ascorbate metabolism protein UlaG (beta-lactamase superfamily)